MAAPQPAAAPQPVAAPQPAAPRTAPRTWVVVLLTLGAVALAGGIFAAGVVTGAVLGRAGAEQDAAAAPAPVPLPAPTGSSGPAGSDGLAGPAPQSGATPGADGAGPPLDPCLVGSWRTVEHEEQYRTEQGPAGLTGLTRLLEVAADGTQTIRYDASEATVTTEAGALPAVFDGEVRYRVSTEGTTMSFELLSSEGTVTVRAPDGTEQVEDLQAGVGPVTYTCDGQELTQQAEGFSARYERTS